MAILTTLILLVHEHEASFHFFVFFKSLLIMPYSFQCVGPSHPLLRVFLSTKIYSFCCSCKSSCFSTYFSELSLSVHRSAVECCALFCVLQLHCVTVCLSFQVLVRSLGFSL